MVSSRDRSHSQRRDSPIQDYRQDATACVSLSIQQCQRPSPGNPEPAHRALCIDEASGRLNPVRTGHVLGGWAAWLIAPSTNEGPRQPKRQMGSFGPNSRSASPPRREPRGDRVGGGGLVGGTRRPVNRLFSKIVRQRDLPQLRTGAASDPRADYANQRAAPLARSIQATHVNGAGPGPSGDRCRSRCRTAQVRLGSGMLTPPPSSSLSAPGAPPFRRST